MKKVALLLSAMFMFGCGGGGETTTSSTPSANTGGNSAAGPVASFTIKLQDGDVQTAGPGKVVGLVVDAAATHARVVVRQINTVETPVYGYAEYDEETGAGIPPLIQVGTKTESNETYKQVYDPAIATDSSISFATPRSVDSTDLYTFDVLTYTAGSPNALLKYGRLVDVNVGGAGTATITINDLCVDLGKAFTDNTKVGRIHVVKPDLVKSNFKFNITPNVKTPINTRFAVTATTQSTNTFVGPVSASFNANITAPVSYNAADILLGYQLDFFISADMLKSGEKYTDWVRTDNSLNSKFSSLLNLDL